MNRCKECEYFKNDCGFSSVDAQLKLDGNFVACGQFKKMDMWNFIHSATKISFPDEVRSSWNLLFEYIPAGEPCTQYRLYLDDNGIRKYTKISLKTGMNV